MTLHIICASFIFFSCFSKVVIACCCKLHAAYIKKTIIYFSEKATNTCITAIFHICYGGGYILDFDITAARHCTNHAAISSVCFASACGSCRNERIIFVGISFYGQGVFHDCCTIWICTFYSVICSNQSAQICYLSFIGHICRDGRCCLSRDSYCGRSCTGIFKRTK